MKYRASFVSVVLRTSRTGVTCPD